MRLRRFLCLIALLMMPALTFAQTGKISGEVKGANDGAVLPGANVVIVGTSLGAATDSEGFYTILNVPPGVYTLQANFIGYTKTSITDVRVSINQTTTIDFEMKEEAVAGAEVTVVSVRPVVEPDVSANVANITADQTEFLPVAGVDQIITLQAGVEPNMNIRGSGLDQTAYLLDGISLRDGRDNTPFTGVSFTAFNEVQIQTGGFNAEYGNVRSGLIQVTSKDPGGDYTADTYVRLRPVQDLNFDGSPKDADAYWVRPYKDPAVKNVGTSNGPWDQYTQRQYPAFDGWDVVAESPLIDDFGNEVTVSAGDLEKIFDYHMRKDLDIEDADHDVDLTFGGPLIPGGSLGNLRFLASYRKIQEAYLYPQRRSSYKTDTWQFKVAADLKPTMKLQFLGMISNENGMAHSAFNRVDNPNPIRGGVPVFPWDFQGLVSNINSHVGRSLIFGNDRLALTDVDRTILGGKFTHSLSPNTFYQARIQYSKSDYFSRPGTGRDFATVVNTIGGFQLNEAPFGYSSKGVSSPGSQLRLSGHWARARDTSLVEIVTANFDITSQVDRRNQVKAGVELVFSDYDMHVGSRDSVIVHGSRSFQAFREKPVQLGAYLQDKLEFEGLIMNLGLRLDYFSAGTDWWVYGPYDRAFIAKNANIREELLEKEATETQVTLSPRIGVSFPISANSKLYFNYGHFRQNLDPISVFEFESKWSGDLGRLGNPNHPLQKTVAYELGYDHNLADKYLIRISGYYKDLSNQPALINFTGIDQLVNYDVQMPFNYSDVRGIELTINKTRGRWIRGFVNYTFMQTKAGNFGFRQNFENLVTQREYLRDTEDHFQSRPIAQPFANFNLELGVPDDFSPLLRDWNLNVLGLYRSGRTFTWAGRGGAIPGLEQNVRMRDFWNLDLRLSRTFKTSFGSAMLFFDVNNALNLRYTYFAPGNGDGGAFEGQDDWNHYMESLHLNPDAFSEIDESTIPYKFISGDDRPGDFRHPDVAFVPIEIVTSQADLPDDPGFLEQGRRVLYYLDDSGRYMEFQNGSWNPADQGFVDQVLEDKAYIDMPNETYRTFLNPRSFRFGLRFSF